jgi:signal transduction histidine kinase
MVTNALTYHPLLFKQIESLSSHYFVDPSIAAFLERINKSYNRLEKDKQLSDHAFELTEKEYTSANKDLVRQVKLRMESTQKLKDAIQLFDNEISFDAEGHDDDILSIISYLKKQIEKSKDLEASLRKAKEEAETASIAKGDFLSVMSHEIRTPLNAVNGIIHLLLLDNPGPHQMENLKALDISAENLLSLINDILDFSKMENGKILFNHRHFELRPFVENIKLTYNRCAQDKANTIELNIDPEIPAHIKGDDLRLRQILNNLVSNAIKFTKEGVVIVSVKLKEQNDHKITPPL